MSTALATLSNKLAERFDLGSNGADVIAILKATAFKGPATDAQLTALLIVAQQYGLNPFTKEIYAFPDKNNGIVPVVGVDGWARIINGHQQFDGMEFVQDEESCTCIMYRKDRGHPVKVTEYMAECRRQGAGPWQSHPKRMLRHKSMIQCARLAFGYAGIYDPDEAERIISAGETYQRQATVAKVAKVDTSEIEDTKNLDELREVFKKAWMENPHKDSREILTKAKDKRRKEIEDSVPNNVLVDLETGEVIENA